MDLRNLPYVPPNQEIEERRLTRYPRPDTQPPPDYGKYSQFQSLLKNVFQPTPAMPPPLLTFDGINSAQSGCGCFPPDTNGDVGPNHYVESTNTLSRFLIKTAHVQSLLKNIWQPQPTMPGPLLTFEGHNNTCGCFPPDSDGDVGPNHYVEAVNESIKIFDKNGNTLSGPTTYNSFFARLTGTPCANANDGDPFVLYDPVADRWIMSDFAFPSFPGNSFYQCIGISQTPDPVSGGWFLYALQVDPANPTFLGDYPKFAMWNAGGSPAQNAYFLTVNLFSSPTTFNGVRAFALDRATMLAGGPANAIGFTLQRGGCWPIPIASSLLTLRTGIRRLREEMKCCWLSIAPATGGVIPSPGPRPVVSCRFCHAGEFYVRHWRQSCSERRDHGQHLC